MQILVLDVGGTHVKILASGQEIPRKFVSGPSLTVEKMVTGAPESCRGMEIRSDIDRLSRHGSPRQAGFRTAQPRTGWVGFDFEAAFRCPVKIVNDAAMQALGSDEGGRMLFLGLGTGLGSTMIVDYIVEPMELGHLPYKKGTYEDYIGIRGLSAQAMLLPDTSVWRFRITLTPPPLTAASPMSSRSDCSRPCSLVRTIPLRQRTNRHRSQLHAKEDAARKVEREMSKRLAAVALQHRIGEVFDAIVSGVTEHAPKWRCAFTSVRLTRLPQFASSSSLLRRTNSSHVKSASCVSGPPAVR